MTTTHGGNGHRGLPQGTLAQALRRNARYAIVILTRSVIEASATNITGSSRGTKNALIGQIPNTPAKAATALHWLA